MHRHGGRPDAAHRTGPNGDPAVRTARISAQIDIGAYVGIPIVLADGELLGAADIDPLTGMCTQLSWDRFTASEEPRVRRFGDPVVVILVELDRRRSIYDATGQAGGDELIESVAKVLRNMVRNDDFVARLSGDEFGIIASNVVPERCDRPELVGGNREAVAAGRLDRALTSHRHARPRAVGHIGVAVGATITITAAAAAGQ